MLLILLQARILAYIFNLKIFQKWEWKESNDNDNDNNNNNNNISDNLVLPTEVKSCIRLTDSGRRRNPQIPGHKDSQHLP